jgi:hypothetical protein
VHLSDFSISRQSSGQALFSSDPSQISLQLSHSLHVTVRVVVLVVGALDVVVEDDVVEVVGRVVEVVLVVMALGDGESDRAPDGAGAGDA